MDNKTKIIVLILGVLVVAIVGVNVFLAPSSGDAANAQNITDMANRTVEIPGNVGRVVATSPPMTTIMYMLAPDKLVGLNFQWTDAELEFVPSQYKGINVVGGWFGSQDGNYEEFIASEPDIVIESVDESGDYSTIQERQEKFGTIPVVGVLDDTNVSTMHTSISFMGKIIGADDKANQLNDFNQKNLDKVNQVTSSLSESDKKTVYYAEGEDGLSTDGSGSTHGQLIDLCGGINVAELPTDSNSSSVQVSIEQVMSWNPDVIICNDPDFYNGIYNDSNWASINAVKNHQVYCSPQSPFKWFDRPTGANMIMGVPWTAKVIYPDKYTDLHLKDLTKEFYSNFYHYDLSDQQVTTLLNQSGLSNDHM